MHKLHILHYILYNTHMLFSAPSEQPLRMLLSTFSTLFGSNCIHPIHWEMFPWNTQVPWMGDSKEKHLFPHISCFVLTWIFKIYRLSLFIRLFFFSFLLLLNPPPPLSHTHTWMKFLLQLQNNQRLSRFLWVSWSIKPPLSATGLKWKCPSGDHKRVFFLFVDFCH